MPIPAIAFRVAELARLPGEIQRINRDAMAAQTRPRVEGSDQVWNISGLTGNVAVPKTDVTGYGPNKCFLFTADATSVPDGGTTIALLGFALVGVDFLRRKLT